MRSRKRRKSKKKRKSSRKFKMKGVPPYAQSQKKGPYGRRRPPPIITGPPVRRPSTSLKEYNSAIVRTAILKSELKVLQKELKKLKNRSCCKRLCVRPPVTRIEDIEFNIQELNTIIKEAEKSEKDIGDRLPTALWKERGRAWRMKKGEKSRRRSKKNF